MKKEQKLKEALEGMLSVVDGPLKEAAQEFLRLSDEIEKVRKAFEPVYKVGDRFKFTGVIGGEYILSKWDSNVILTNLESGNQFTEPVEVEDPYEITLEEFRKITSNRLDQFHLIKSSDLKQHINS